MDLRGKPGKEAFMEKQMMDRNMQTTEEGMIVGYRAERVFALKKVKFGYNFPGIPIISENLSENV